MDKFFQSMVSPGEGVNTLPLVLYGAARFAVNGRGELYGSVPTTSTFKKCQSKFPAVIPVPEYNTTKMHSKCRRRRTSLKRQRSNKQMAELQARYPGQHIHRLVDHRGAKICKICNEIVSRDDDSCDSIKDCELAINRPAEYMPGANAAAQDVFVLRVYVCVCVVVWIN
jgi:hypothetical protein